MNHTINRNIGNIFAKFKNGLNIAYSSFALLWENKKLLIYLGIPILAGALVEILAYNLQTSACCLGVSFSQKDTIARILKSAGSYNWFRYLNVIVLYFLYLAALTFENMVLTYHTWKIKQQEPISIRRAFAACFPKLKMALIWATCILIPIVTFYVLNDHIQKASSVFLQLFYTTVLFSIFASWSLVTAFVIQIITLENLGIVDAIKKSFSMIQRTFFEYLGALFWISLITGLCAIPFLILERYLHTIYLVSIPLVLITYCFITSAYTVSKTLLYVHDKSKHLVK